MPSRTVHIDDWNWWWVPLSCRSLSQTDLSWTSHVLGPLDHDSVMSLALLTFGYSHRYCVVVNVFPHVEGAADRQVIIMRRKSQGPNLVPEGAPDGTLPYSERQSLLSHVTLWNLSERKSITQLMILLGTLTCFNSWLRYYDLSDQRLYSSRKETSHMAVHFSGLIIEPLEQTLELAVRRSAWKRYAVEKYHYWYLKFVYHQSLD